MKSLPVLFALLVLLPVCHGQTPYPGSGQDFTLESGINATPTETPSIKLASPGDTLVLHYGSPAGTYNFTLPLLIAQIYVTATPPSATPGLPELHVDPSALAPWPIIILHNGLATPFPPSLLPPGGLTNAYTVPMMPTGSSIMFQAFSLSPSPTNPIFTATDGHEIRMM